MREYVENEATEEEKVRRQQLDHFRTLESERNEVRLPVDAENMAKIAMELREISERVEREEETAIARE